MFRGEESKRRTWTVDDDRLARMIEILGPFPSESLAQGTDTAKFFNEKGLGNPFLSSRIGKENSNTTQNGGKESSAGYRIWD